MLSKPTEQCPLSRSFHFWGNAQTIPTGKLDLFRARDTPSPTGKLDLIPDRDTSEEMVLDHTLLHKERHTT